MIVRQVDDYTNINLTTGRHRLKRTLNSCSNNIGLKFKILILIVYHLFITC